MNVLAVCTEKVQSKDNKQLSFKNNEKVGYKDPLKSWPLKGLAYSTEVGSIVGVFSPKTGSIISAPALMYYGADIYDKYKNEENAYNPSAKRAVKEAVSQAISGVIFTPLAVFLGQMTTSGLSRFTKDGLTIQSKQEIIGHSLEYMQSKSLHTFVDDVETYKQGFRNSILTRVQDAKGEFKSLTPAKKVLNLINPFKMKESIFFAKEKRIAAFADKQAEMIFTMRADLMQNKKPKNLSENLFNKFQDVQKEYKRIYPADKVVGKAAKSIIKEHHNNQILDNKLVRTIGGCIGIMLLAKPIEDFVDTVVMQKIVNPMLDSFSNNYHARKNAVKQ